MITVHHAMTPAGLGNQAIIRHEVYVRDMDMPQDQRSVTIGGFGPEGFNAAGDLVRELWNLWDAHNIGWSR